MAAVLPQSSAQEPLREPSFRESCEARISHASSRSGPLTPVPLAVCLGELEALRWQLRDASTRLAHEQDELVAAVFNKLQGDPMLQQAFKRPSWASPVPSENSPVNVGGAGATVQPLGTIADQWIISMGPSFLYSEKEPEPALATNGSSNRAERCNKFSSEDTHTNSALDGVIGPSLKCAGLSRTARLESSRLSHSLTELVHQVSIPDNRFVLFFISVLSWLEDTHEPRRTGLLARIITSRMFETLCIVVISLNGLFIIKTANEEMGQVIEGSSVNSFRSDVMGEVFFTSFYVIELALRISVHRLYFLCNEDWKWNIFDLVLVLSSIADLATQLLVAKDKDGDTTNVVFLRIWRIAKIAKIIRMFRALQFVSDLRLMVDSVFGSFFALFWCIVLISFVLYVFALFFVQSMANFLSASHDTLTREQVSKILDYFGSVEVAIVSLFQATTGGEDWRHFYEVVSYAGPLQSVLFIFYITFFVVAAWNIVTSTFVEKAFKMAQPDIESLLLEKRRKDLADGKQFMNLLEELDDRQRQDKITLEEFLRLSENDRFLDFFNVRGLDIKDADMFFRMLKSVSDTEDVDLNTFVAGCLRMKGLATSIDLHTLSFETKSMVMRQRQWYAHVEARLKRLDKRLCQLFAEDDQRSRAISSRVVAAPPEASAKEAEPVPPAVFPLMQSSMMINEDAESASGDIYEATV